jgi:hypothetical protein
VAVELDNITEIVIVEFVHLVLPAVSLINVE